MKTQFLSELFDMPWNMFKIRILMRRRTFCEQMFNEACDRNAPYREIRQISKYMAPWMTKEMLELGRKRNVNEWQKLIEHQKDEDWLVARQLRNQANNFGETSKKKLLWRWNKQQSLQSQKIVVSG